MCLHGNDKEQSKWDKNDHKKKLKVEKGIWKGKGKQSENQKVNWGKKYHSICLKAAELRSTLKGVQVVKKLRESWIIFKVKRHTQYTLTAGSRSHGPFLIYIEEGRREADVESPVCACVFGCAFVNTPMSLWALG